MEQNKKSYALPIAMMFALFFMVAFVTGLPAPFGVIVKNQFGVALGLPPDQSSRISPCRRLVVKIARYESNSVLPQGTFTP